MTQDGRRLVLTLIPRRILATDTAVPQDLELDLDYYQVEDVIEWVGLAIHDPSNVVDFLLADGTTFSLDVDLYDRIGVEAID